MKTLIFAFLFMASASQSYALDCEKTLQVQPAIDCVRLSGHELEIENSEIMKMLLHRKEAQEGNTVSGSQKIPETLDFLKKFSLCSDELHAIMEYTGGDYSLINPSLRLGAEDSLNSELQRKICLLSAGLDKIPTNQETLYRGTSLKKAIADNYLTIGNTVTDLGFASTSKDLEQARRFSRTDDLSKTRIIMKYAGVEGHTIKELSYSPLEDEYLIDRGQKFQVRSVTLMTDGSWLKDYYLVELKSL
jgi:hypothetical protein